MGTSFRFSQYSSWLILSLFHLEIHLVQCIFSCISVDWFWNQMLDCLLPCAGNFLSHNTENHHELLSCASGFMPDKKTLVKHLLPPSLFISSTLWYHSRGALTRLYKHLSFHNFPRYSTFFRWFNVNRSLELITLQKGTGNIHWTNVPFHAGGNSKYHPFSCTCRAVVPFIKTHLWSLLLPDAPFIPLL